MSPVDLERIKQYDPDEPHYGVKQDIDALVAEVEALRAEIARLTAEQIETEKQLTDELVNQKIGRLRAEADLAAARAALEKLLPYHPHPPYPEGHKDHPHVIIVSALMELGTGEALAVVREAQKTIRAVVATVEMVKRDFGGELINADSYEQVRAAQARLRAVFGEKL